MAVDAETDPTRVSLPLDLVRDIAGGLIGAGLLDYPHVPDAAVLDVLRTCGTYAERLVAELEAQGVLPADKEPPTP